MIENGSKVRFHYTLTVDGDVVDSSADREPLEYEHGSGQIIPGLESALLGLDAGDRKEMDVPPEQAYGPVDPAAVQQVPKSAFQDPDTLSVGDMVAGTMSGQTFRARITEVGAEMVGLDLNHPLAGKTLHFAVEIVSVG